MSFDHARIAIEKAFFDGWASQTGTIMSADAPMNIKDVQIVIDGVEADTIDTPYVALFIKDGDSSQIEIGPPPQFCRYLGMVLAIIRTEDRKGSQAARLLADAVGNIFKRASLRYQQSGLIRFRIPRITTVGSNGGRFELQVDIPFWRDKQE